MRGSHWSTLADAAVIMTVADVAMAQGLARIEAHGSWELVERNVASRPWAMLDRVEGPSPSSSRTAR
jgi:hypothetical protein